MPHLRRPRLPFLPLLLVLAAGAASCGGGEPEGEAPRPEDVGGQPAAEPQESPFGARVTAMDPAAGPPGTQVRLEATGLPARSRIEIGFGAPNTNFEILHQTEADGLGQVEATVVVPEWAEAGRGYMFVFAPVDRPPLAASDTFRVGDARNLVRVEGVLTDEGVECPALRADGGELYTLTGLPDGFRPGDRIRIEGEPAQMSLCMQGVTLEVRRAERP